MAYLIIILGWGIWSIADKQTLKYMSPIKIYLYCSIMAMFEIPFWYYLARRENKDVFSTPKEGIYWLLLAVIATSSAALCFLYSLKTAHAGWLSAISCLYLIVTFILSVLFFNEPMTTSKIFGVILMIMGAYFLGK
jgi:drug/metabolite transporter (DMT)-like permease